MSEILKAKVTEGVIEQREIPDCVVLNCSTFEKETNAAVLQKFEAWVHNYVHTDRYMKHYAERGVHYIIKMVECTQGSEEVVFDAEIRTSDTKDLYARAKVQQLEAFRHLSHTGGESLHQVRNMMLARGAAAQDVDDFYSDYKPDDPVDVISNEAAVWLRDTFGIAPWYGAWKIPGVIRKFLADGGELKEQFYIVAGFSGCENSQEDLLNNAYLTVSALETFAGCWGQDIIKLDLKELRENPVTETWIYYSGLDDIVIPAR